MPIIELSSIEPKEIAKGYSARFIHTGSMTFSYIDVTAGSVINEHSHINEQVSHVLEGIFRMTIDGVEHTFGPGSVCVIPPNVKHGGFAVTDCKLLDVFNPVREDYRKL